VIVLLIVAANVSVLVVLRAMRRERELAVRFALGARTRQIAKLLGLEALVVCATGWGLGMIASVVGLAMASPAIEARLGLPVPGGTSTLSVDGVVLLAAAAGATSVTMLLSFVPLALPFARRFHQTLRSGARSGTEGPRVRRSRSLLVAFQVAASVVLVFGGALVARTVTNLVRTDLGYDAESLVRARVRFPERPFPDSASISNFQLALESAVAERTGSRVAIATVLPFFEKGPQRLEVEGAGYARASVNAVGSSYFELAGVSLRAGRAFTAADNLGAERVAIVSQALARALGAGGSVLGTRIRTGTDMNSGDEPAVWRTIVGVVSDVRETHRDVDYRDVYLPAAQMGGRYASIYARTPGSGLREWHNEVRSIARGINPGVEIAAPVRLSEGAHQELAAPRFLRSVFAGLAALALGLALLGIYGVTAYAVEQRRLEVAVRSALGAPERTIVRLFLTQGARVVAIGTGAGMVGASWLGRLLENQVFGIAPGDSVTLVASAGVVAVGCLVATWLPSRLAARVHPAEVLRTD
jgi:predicted permease